MLPPSQPVANGPPPWAVDLQQTLIRRIDAAEDVTLEKVDQVIAGIDPRRIDGVNARIDQDKLIASIEELRTEVRVNSARTHNLAVRASNEIEELLLIPLRKEKPGYGTQKANYITGDLTNYQFEVIPAPQIGDEPTNFPEDYEALVRLSSEDILRLIVYYNDEFGILPQDALANKRYKFMKWMKGIRLRRY